MNTSHITGTPPQIWQTTHLRKGIKLGADLVRAERDLRLHNMAKQIEKLSWMVEYMEEQLDWDPMIEDAEAAWLKR